MGCEPWRRASHQHPTPRSGWSSPQVQTCSQHLCKAQELAFQSSICLAGRQSEVQPPDFTTKSGWKRTGPALAGRVAPLLSVTAAQQKACGQGCKRLHPTQACRRRQEPPQEPEESRGLLTAAGWLLSTAPTPRKHRPQQRTAWVTPGHAAATALAQFFPSEQAGLVSSWQSVCLCPPHPQRTQLSGAVLPCSPASSRWSNSML